MMLCVCNAGLPQRRPTMTAKEQTIALFIIDEMISCEDTPMSVVLNLLVLRLAFLYADNEPQ